MNARKIIHIDMDCFFASVEMRDNPKLRDVPIAIAGSSRRAVISTANYPARKFGVHSAMPVFLALQKCPNLLLIPHHMDKYMEESETIHSIFYEFTDLVEPLSCDEAFLDVTDCPYFQGSATLIAKEIKRQIYNRTRLTASAGISCNKFLAKVASDWKKPDGLFVIPPDQAEQFAGELPVGKVFGIGKVTEKNLHYLGIYKCIDARAKGLPYLIEHFGKAGEMLYQYSFGIDDRPVIPNRQLKSVSTEMTFEFDLEDYEEWKMKLPLVLEELERRLKNFYDSSKGTQELDKMFVKVKSNTFKTTSVEKKMDFEDIYDTERTKTISKNLASQFEDLLFVAHSRLPVPIRLLGLGFRFKDEDQSHQESLF